MLILNESDLRSLLSMREVIDAVEAGFCALARGDVNAPERLRLDLPGRKGILLEMPAYAGLDGAGALGTKIVSVFEQNAEFGLDVIQAIYLLLDRCSACFDGRALHYRHSHGRGLRRRYPVHGRTGIEAPGCVRRGGAGGSSHKRYDRARTNRKGDDRISLG
jgi:hypothetical protein